MTGTLTLVATPIGNLGDISRRAVEVLRQADVIACEDTRRARALLSHLEIPTAGRLHAMHAHNERQSAASLVERLTSGAAIAYVTDAGTPGISDPGEVLVRACLDAGIAVDVVPGASALVAALVLSGLPTERFAFEGFLPRKGRARADRLAAVAADTRTQVIYESPSRVDATLADLAAVCGAERPVAVARELTKLHQDVWRGVLGEAIGRLGGAAARGEHVLVVGGAPPLAPADEATITAAVEQALGRGLSARDAAGEVAAELGVPRRLAYERALTIRSS
jgi:16S rRNA (cytidine1402-2'-O)-methyltransferase